MVNVSMASGSGTNYYQILGVARNAKESEIKTAYKKAALKYHPDKNPDNDEAEEIFKKINEAYTTLEDKSKRMQYDLTLPVHATFSAPGFPSHTAYVPSGYHYGGPSNHGSPANGETGTFTEEEFYANLKPNMYKSSAAYIHPNSQNPKKKEQVFNIWVRGGNRVAYDWKQLLSATSYRQFSTCRPKPDSGYDGTSPFLDYQTAMLAFRHLQKIKFSVEDIKDTGIGKELKRYSKWHPQAPVKRLATNIMDQWRDEHSVKKQDPVKRNAFGMPAKGPKKQGSNSFSKNPKASPSKGDGSTRASVDHTAIPEFMKADPTKKPSDVGSASASSKIPRDGNNLHPPAKDKTSASSATSTLEGRGRTHLAASMESMGLKQEKSTFSKFVGEQPLSFNQEVAEKLRAMQGLASRKKRGPNIPTPLPGIDKTTFDRQRAYDRNNRFNSGPIGSSAPPAPVGSKLQEQFGHRVGKSAQNTVADEFIRRTGASASASAPKPSQSQSSLDILGKLRAKRDAAGKTSSAANLAAMASAASKVRPAAGTKRKSADSGPTFSAPDRPLEPPKKKKSPPRFKPFKTKPM